MNLGREIKRRGGDREGRERERYSNLRTQLEFESKRREIQLVSQLLASSSSNISHDQQGIKPAASMNNIFILCDSNGNHPDQKRLFPRSHAKKLWCPTTQVSKGYTAEWHPKSIPHNHTHRDKRSQCKKNCINQHSRRDTPKSVIDKMNAKLMSFCAGIPNV